MDTFTIVALDGALGASVAITLDILRTANQIAENMNRPTLTWRVIGSSSLVQMNNGMLIQATPLAEAKLQKKSILVIPGLGLESTHNLDAYGRHCSASRQLSSSPVLLEERLAYNDVLALAELAHNHYLNGYIVAASCSSVLALGCAGLLEGRTATTHWRLYELLRKRHPGCMLDTSRMLVQDGRLITAGAAMSQMDLMLLLLRNTAGHEISELTRRYLLIDGRPTQSHYMTLADLQMECRETLRLEKLVEKYMPNVPSLKRIAEELLVTEKTLTRRIQKATGLTPLTFIQRVRLRHAQTLLETTQLTIDEVATQVGYADSTALRRLIIKNMGCTPSQLRGELQSLGRA
jgi:transcriptional regulator GlxA family with amidase domain